MYIIQIIQCKKYTYLTVYKIKKSKKGRGKGELQKITKKKKNCTNKNSVRYKFSFIFFSLHEYFRGVIDNY